jgi:hypothetical protein
MNFKTFYENIFKKVNYSAVVLDYSSRDALIKFPEINDKLSENMDIIAHHMTIKLGELKNTKHENRIGKTEILYATHVGISDNGSVVAVKVQGDSENEIPHVTIGVDRKAGGKPVMSNYIKNWTLLSRPLKLIGKVEEL